MSTSAIKSKKVGSGIALARVLPWLGYCPALVKCKFIVNEVPKSRFASNCKLLISFYVKKFLSRKLSVIIVYLIISNFLCDIYY